MYGSEEVRLHTRFVHRALTVAIGLALFGGLAPRVAHAAPPTMTPTEIAGGLAIPWDIAFAPDGKMLVTERAGRVRVYSGGNIGATLVHTENVPAVAPSGEAGLMGIAVDTDFASNPFVYVCATRAGPVNEVLRYELRGSGDLMNPIVILSGMSAANIHNGCALEMDRHGFLWVTMGDANVPSRAQNPASLNGKVLRIHRDGSIPGDNPFGNAVYSMGHRNPQGLAFRPGTDQVYVVEHGPDRDDEINIVGAGGNYGWPCYTGVGQPYQTSGCGAASAYGNPIWASGSPTIATSGAAFVSGAQWGDSAGNLFVSTLKGSDVRQFPVNADGSVNGPLTHFDGSWGRLRAMVSGPGGQLYATTSNGSNDRVIRISPAVANVSRAWGADRYATAAAVSQSQFPGGADNVMVATGTNFPDALAGSAAAGMLNMPVLLVTRDVIPNATLQEIDRLNPQRIWILGGEGAVSEGVRQALAPYAATGEAPRLWGADRYATAAAISAQWYAPGVPAVFIATGTAFPDALAGAPAAALHDSPLLLVKPGEIPAATAAELDRLNPQRIYVLGGPGAVSDAVGSQLHPYTGGPVTRLWGADRYATAAAVSAAFWGHTAAFVATGRNFPDALAGGAAAGRHGIPLLLVSTSGVPAATGMELLRIQGMNLIMLGGPGAIDGTAEAQLRALVGNP
jgi:glucose/arabinose dehydrogenase/putative cell wall-binding protein